MALQVKEGRGEEATSGHLRCGTLISFLFIRRQPKDFQHRVRLTLKAHLYFHTTFFGQVSLDNNSFYQLRICLLSDNRRKGFCGKV